MLRNIVLVALLLAIPLIAKEEKILKITGSGKVMVKANIADVRIGIEEEGKTALIVQTALAEKLPKILESLKSPQIEKLETGAMMLSPEYTNGNPPEIKGYRGRIEILFSSAVENAGRYIGKAFEAGANQLGQVNLRPSDAVLEEARLQALKEASKAALNQAHVVLNTLGLEEKEIMNIDVQPFDGLRPLYRAATEPALMSTKNRMETTILEGEQSVHSHVNLSLEFRESQALN